MNTIANDHYYCEYCLSDPTIQGSGNLFMRIMKPKRPIGLNAEFMKTVLMLSIDS